MNNILTGQFDLTLLQSKVGIGIEQLTDFIQGTGVEIISNWIQLQIVTNLMGVIALLLFMIGLGFAIRHTIKQLIKRDDGRDHENTVSAFFIILLIYILPIVIFVYTLGMLLAWTIAPEMTFIQHFIR